MTRREIYNAIALQLRDIRQTRFTDDVIDVFFIPIYKRMCRNYGAKPGKLFEKSESFSVVSDGNYLSLPDDFGGTLNAVTDEVTDVVLDNDLDYGKSIVDIVGDPISYELVGQGIYFDHLVSAGRSFTLNYTAIHPLPDIASDSEVVSPSAWLLIYETAIALGNSMNMDTTMLVDERRIEEAKILTSIQKRDHGTMHGIDRFGDNF